MKRVVFLYRSRVKIWEFPKARARDLVLSKQPPIQEIGAMQRGLKTEMLAKGKTKFWKMIGIGSLIFLLVGCGSHRTEPKEQLTSVQIVDRNGFKETISAEERLNLYRNTNFLAPQPYERVLRMYGRDTQGKTHSKLTTYHENGEVWQYLEILNGRACGTYREWHENGVLRLDIVVIEGIGELGEEAQLGWVFDGLSRVWDDQGRILAEINYEKGKLQGTAYFYHPNGKVRELIPYDQGLINGDLLYFSEEGKVIGKTPFVKGKKEGFATFQGNSSQPPYSEEYHDDRLVKATYQDFQGKIIAEISEGFGHQAIFQDGKLTSIREFQKGVPNGEVKLFDQRERVKSLYHTKDGTKHGREWVYYTTFREEEPKPKLYLEWLEDTVHGICRTWYPNGCLESEREMVDNKKHGISTAWYKDGSIMLIEEYENDQLVSGSYMKKGDPTPISFVEEGEGTATFHDSEGVFVRRALYKNGQPIDED